MFVMIEQGNPKTKEAATNPVRNSKSPKHDSLQGLGKLELRCRDDLWVQAPYPAQQGSKELSPVRAPPRHDGALGRLASIALPKPLY